ncbi:hypothetical protein LTR40_012652, partial [Exophiala xenobiotica]
PEPRLERLSASLSRRHRRDHLGRGIEYLGVCLPARARSARGQCHGILERHIRQARADARRAAGQGQDPQDRKEEEFCQWRDRQRTGCRSGKGGGTVCERAEREII